MRGWINDVRGEWNSSSAGVTLTSTGYLPPVKVGAVMRAAGIGYVAASRASKLPVGTLVS